MCVRRTRSLMLPPLPLSAGDFSSLLLWVLIILPLRGVACGGVVQVALIRTSNPNMYAQQTVRSMQGHECTCVYVMKILLTHTHTFCPTCTHTYSLRQSVHTHICRQSILRPVKSNVRVNIFGVTITYFAVFASLYDTYMYTRAIQRR